MDKEPKAMQSENTHIHGMTTVTPAALAYIATQVCLPLIFVCRAFAQKSYDIDIGLICSQ